jgi:hypothetical protein
VWLLVAITVSLVAAVLGLLLGTVLRHSKGLEVVLAVSQGLPRLVIGQRYIPAVLALKSRLQRGARSALTLRGLFFFLRVLRNGTYCRLCITESAFELSPLLQVF